MDPSAGQTAMILAPGSHVGPYEIVESVGAGGMGEVYRARDTRLHRDVAVKALPAAFAFDPVRLSMLERAVTGRKRARDRASGCRRAGSRARTGHRPSRFEARKHQGSPGRDGEAP